MKCDGKCFGILRNFYDYPPQTLLNRKTLLKHLLEGGCFGILSASVIAFAGLA